VGSFEEHLAPAEWSADLDSDGARELATVLARLRQTAHQVVAAALDASLARPGRARLGHLLEAAAEPARE
jgi:hypothetical protein